MLGASDPLLSLGFSNADVARLGDLQRGSDVTTAVPDCADIFDRQVREILGPMAESLEATSSSVWGRVHASIRALESVPSREQVRQMNYVLDQFNIFLTRLSINDIVAMPDIGSMDRSIGDSTGPQMIVDLFLTLEQFRNQPPLPLMIDDELIDGLRETHDRIALLQKEVFLGNTIISGVPGSAGAGFMMYKEKPEFAVIIAFGALLAWAFLNISITPGVRFHSLLRRLRESIIMSYGIQQEQDQIKRNYNRLRDPYQKRIQAEIDGFLSSDDCPESLGFVKWAFENLETQLKTGRVRYNPDDLVLAWTVFRQSIKIICDRQVGEEQAERYFPGTLQHPYLHASQAARSTYLDITMKNNDLSDPSELYRLFQLNPYTTELGVDTRASIDEVIGDRQRYLHDKGELYCEIHDIVVPQ